MARGWESKSVEDQIAAAEAGREKRPVPDRSEDDRARDARRLELQLSRARVLQDLQVACDKRYRALLERTLGHIDDELGVLG